MSRPRPVLVLGGTAEAHALATALHAGGVAVVSSLAGRVARPRLPPGEVRVGGFGGVDGLTAWLAARDAAAVVDATHPFAARMAANAAGACAAAGVPLLRLDRPGWCEQAGDHWHRVGDAAEAARAVPARGRRVLLALGRQDVGAFAGIEDVWFLIRSVGPPSPPVPPWHALELDRGPFTLAGELALLRRHAIDAVVTRDSGGEQTSAKLVAARKRGLPVIILRRPARPALPTVATVPEAAAWARERG